MATRRRQTHDKFSINNTGLGRWWSLGTLMIALWASPVHSGDIIAGKQLYQTHCEACHGIQGRPHMPNAPDFSRGEALMQSDMTLLGTIGTGKNTMPGFRGILKDDQIINLISYLRTLF
jgi:cytochrome c6